MAIAPLPSSPTGEISHGGARTKINEIITEVNKLPIQEIVINNEAGIPAAFDQDNTVYRLKKPGLLIPAAGRDVTGDNIIITADNEYQEIDYASTGEMFRVTGKNVTFKNFSPQAPTGKFVDVTAPASGVGVFFLQNLQDVNCDTFAEIGNVQITSIDLCKIDDCNNGIIFTGANATVRSVTRVAMFSIDTGFVGVDLGSSITVLLDYDRLVLGGPSGAVGLSGAANSANIVTGQIATVMNTNFIGDITRLVGLDVNDVRYLWQNNSGLDDSSTDAQASFPRGTSTTIGGTQGDYFELGVPDTGAWNITRDNRFTFDTAGVATYVGEKPISLPVHGAVTVAKSSGGSDLLELVLAKNWTGAGDAGIGDSRSSTQNNAATGIETEFKVDLITNDTIRIVLANLGSNATMDISAARLNLGDGN